MKTTTLYIIASGMILSILAGFLLFKRSDKNTSPTPTHNNTQTNVDQTENNSITSKNYIEYKSGVLEKISGSRRVLFFYANWCPTCIPADKEFTKSEGLIPEDVILIRVNYNDPDTDQEEKSLAQKYGITYQHTFVQIESSGNEITKWNGGSIKELIENIK